MLVNVVLWSSRCNEPTIVGGGWMGWWWCVDIVTVVVLVLVLVYYFERGRRGVGGNAMVVIASCWPTHRETITLVMLFRLSFSIWHSHRPNESPRLRLSLKIDPRHNHTHMISRSLSPRPSVFVQPCTLTQWL